MTWIIPALAAFAVATIWLSVIDVREHRLPNTATAALLAGLIVLVGLASWGSGEWERWWRSLIAGAVLYVVYLLLNLAHPAGLGMGDVKLAPSIGVVLGWCSWSAVLWGSALAVICVGALSAILLATRQVDMKTALPFGPFMFAGAWIAILGAWFGLL